MAQSRSSGTPQNGQSLSRRTLGAMSIGGAAAIFRLSAARTAAAQGATPIATASVSDELHEIVARGIDTYKARAVIARVLVDGNVAYTEALGESMTGVPATTDMHFRNGAVAISYMATLLLRFVDNGVVGLDDTIEQWLPDLQDAQLVSLRMLANMTAGYPDYVQNQQFIAEFYRDPFQQFTSEQQIAYAMATPRVFAPGENWDYAHSNYVILGLALEQIGGAPLDQLLREYVLDPLGLRNTQSSSTAGIPQPVLHSFSSERRLDLEIPAGIRFYEETTYWNPSWTLARGSVQTTDIFDMAASALAIGTGALLSEASYQAMIGRNLVGFGSLLEGCPTCHTLDAGYAYGLGIVLRGEWVLQNPLFAGYGGLMAYHPQRRIAIAVAATYREDAFDENGDSTSGNIAQAIFADIADYFGDE